MSLRSYISWSGAERTSCFLPMRKQSVSKGDDIVMVTPSGPMVVKEAIKAGLYCFPEIDGVRIFTQQESSFF